MQKHIQIYFMTFVLFWAGSLVAQDIKKENGDMGTLKILIEGFSNDKGSAKISLCNSKEDFKRAYKTFQSATVPIKNGKAEWTFSNLPFGTYAVKVYHDENNNGKLDKNAFGAPKERYGFSNNVRGSFGPPAFEKVSFVVNKAETIITIAIE